MRKGRGRNNAHRRLPLLLLLCAGVAPAQEAKLGKVDFPTSGSPAAQAHFLRGVAALHSFWFEEALEEFRESTKTEPDFAMGYWGEAMALNHPLWGEQDTATARAVLERVNDRGKLTPRERAYLEAVKTLYGPGDKLARDQAYSRAMQRIYMDYPDDLEAACFYALSLLGTVRPGDKSFRRQMEAGAIALEVFRKNPDHPGAAHYIIHAFDDPEHAILALPAARRYASIAPEAHHARHMPSHIFLQLGMWPEAAASNESAWAASDAWVRAKGLPGSLRDFHSLHWLLYVYLQQGRYAKAEELLALRERALTESAEGAAVEQVPTRMGGRYAADMAAALVVETERWPLAAKLFSPPDNVVDQQPAGYDAGAGGHSAHDGQASRSQILAAFIRGLAAAESGLPQAEESAAALDAIRSKLVAAAEPYRAKIVEIMGLEVAAQSAATQGKYEFAIDRMRRAVALEEEMSPPSGPPDLIKPSHELFGEILLRAGRAEEAAQQFATSLLRQPNRARSLLGVARAAARRGDRAGARAAYANFLNVWQRADAKLAELREAQDYTRQMNARAEEVRPAR